MTNHRYEDSNQDLRSMNERLLSVDADKKQKIGVCFMGRQTPGGQNVIDGLIRFQTQRKNVELVGFINGVKGLFANDTETISWDTYKNFVNLGGYEYIGRGPDQIRSEEDKK